MIRTRHMTPNVYSQQSRDFQFIGRLYDLVLNSVKTNADLIYSLPNGANADTAFLELLSMTLGFKSLHNYNVDQLKALCSCFVEVIRNKGNIQSIQKACNALVGAEGITENVVIDDSNYKDGLVIYISQNLSDINLLRDLLNYILPAGLSYSIVETLQVSSSASTTTVVKNAARAITHTASTTSQILDTYNSDDLIGLNITDTAGMLINATITSSYESDGEYNNQVKGKLVEEMPAEEEST